jgi:hypothetical protein
MHGYDALGRGQGGVAPGASASGAATTFANRCALLRTIANLSREKNYHQQPSKIIKTPSIHWQNQCLSVVNKHTKADAKNADFLIPRFAFREIYSKMIVWFISKIFKL